MMLRMSFNPGGGRRGGGPPSSGRFRAGHRTRDIAAGGAFVTCRQMTDFILAEL